MRNYSPCFYIFSNIIFVLRAFADSLIAERFVETVKTCDSSLSPVLSQVYYIY